MNYTKTPWNKLKDLTPDQWTITRILGNLDEIATDFETRWGKGRLPTLVSDDMAAKWERQMEKLNAAIEAEHPDDVLDLALGTRRGWELMEEHALASGHKTLDPHVWEVTAPDGYLYRVFSSQGRAIGENGISVQELVRFYHTARLKTFGIVSTTETQRAEPLIENVLDDDIPW